MEVTLGELKRREISCGWGEGMEVTLGELNRRTYC
jgi:hypothetical protein